MISIAPDHPQSASRPFSRRANGTSDSEEPVKKPKKVNSEIRKQQNRIASRNYREKRKRKLQYLQQLLQDGESPEQAAQAVEEQERMMTPEYQDEKQQQSHQPIYTFPSQRNYRPVTVTSGNTIDPVPSSPVIDYNRQLGHARHPYNTYENAWHAPMYDSPPNINLPGWTIPNWMPNVDFASTESSRPDDFHYTPPHTHNAFEQLPTPPQQSRTPDSELFLLGSYGHCRKADSQQPMGIANVSLSSSASSSPFHYTRYAGGS